MNKTKNLGLSTHGVSEEDLALTFLAWRQRLDGITESNMVKMDDAFGELQESIEKTMKDAVDATNDALEAADTALDSAEKADAATAKANAAATAATTAEGKANTATTRANASADKADAAAKSALDSAATADSSALDATESARDADEAAARANAAADKADEATENCNNAISESNKATVSANSSAASADEAADNANRSAESADRATEAAIDATENANNAALKAEKWENVTATIKILPADGTSVIEIEDTETGKILHFEIPRGLTGLTPDITIGNVYTGDPGTDVIIVRRGTPENPILDITIPRGEVGSIDNMPYATRNPSDLGAEPSVGVIDRVAREDHVHRLPSMEEIGITIISDDEIDVLSFA